jgi:hypothetical protein
MVLGGNQQNITQPAMEQDETLKVASTSSC